MKNPVEQILDFNLEQSSFQKKIDDFTYLVSLLCKSDYSFITILNEKYQFVKSQIGLELDNGPKELSFCRYTIEQGEPYFIVPDTHKDERFQNHPLVIGGPKFRYYAGFPIVLSNKETIGSLCLAHKSVMELNKEQITAMQILASKTANQFDHIIEYQEKENKLNQVQFDMSAVSQNANCALFIFEYYQNKQINYQFLSKSVVDLIPWCTYEESLNQPGLIFEYILPEDIEKIQSTIQNAMDSFSSYTVHYRVLNPITKEIRQFQSIGKPKDSNSDFCVFYGMTQDITLEHDYLKTLDGIIDDVSHIVKQPINLLESLCELIKLDQHADLREIADSSLDLSNQLNQQIEDLSHQYIEKRNQLNQ